MNIGRRNFDDSDEEDDSIMAHTFQGSLKAGGTSHTCPRCGRNDFKSVPALSAHASKCKVGEDLRRPKASVFVARDQGMAHDRFGLLLNLKKAEMAEEKAAKEQGAATSAFGRSSAYWEQQSKQAKAVIAKPLSKTVEQALENARLKRIADKVCPMYKRRAPVPPLHPHRAPRAACS